MIDRIFYFFLVAFIIIITPKCSLSKIENRSVSTRSTNVISIEYKKALLIYDSTINLYAVDSIYILITTNKLK